MALVAAPRTDSGIGQTPAAGGYFGDPRKARASVVWFGDGVGGGVSLG